MKFPHSSLPLLVFLLFSANALAAEAGNPTADNGRFLVAEADVELDVTMEVIDEDVGSSEEVMNIIELPAARVRSDKDRQQGEGEQTRNQGATQTGAAGVGQQQTPQTGQQQTPQAGQAEQRSDAPPAEQRPDSPPAVERPDDIPAVETPESPTIPERPDSPAVPQQPVTPPSVERPVSPPAVERPETPPAVERPSSPPAVERPVAPVAPERPDTTNRPTVDIQKDVQERARETRDSTAGQKGR